MPRTIVYVDGFNLYYRAVKGTPHKWLNIVALCQKSLPATSQIAIVNYYTAHVSGRLDPTSPVRQQAYLRALAMDPAIRIHHGNFLTHAKWAGLAPPIPSLKPTPHTLNVIPAPVVAYVWKTEEKGSDVKLAAHLVRDAFRGNFEEAAVLTNDTDLCEPIRIVTQEIGLPVTLLTPVNQPHTSLTAVASTTRHIKPYLSASQFPDPVIGPRARPIRKPLTW
ncbi:MAG TPA: NYN domain-containing protein [Rhizomicrobium sp.]